MIDIISEAEILRVHGNCNFGELTPRQVVNDGVRKIALGYWVGSTCLAILAAHGLVTWNACENPHLTPFGQKYARSLWPQDKPEKPVSVADSRDQIADIIYQTKGATLGHYKAADQIVELIGLNAGSGPQLAPSDADGWLPIETAPKDGRNPIDLWVVPHHGRQYRRCSMWWLESKEFTGWRGGEFHVHGRGPAGYPVGDFVPTGHTVTHWRPEPESPIHQLPSPVFKSSRGAS